MAEALTRKQIIQAVWNKFKAIIGNHDISGMGDGTVTGALAGLNGNIVKAGSKVITNASNASVSSWGILSNSDVNKILGVTDSVKENTTVLFVNGDYQAFDGIISSYYESGTWVAHFSKPFNPKASVRINYAIAYSKN